MNLRPVERSLGMHRRPLCFLCRVGFVSTGGDSALPSQSWSLSLRAEAKAGKWSTCLFISTCEHPYPETGLGECTFVCINAYKEEQIPFPSKHPTKFRLVSRARTVFLLPFFFHCKMSRVTIFMDSKCQGLKIRERRIRRVQTLVGLQSLDNRQRADN